MKTDLTKILSISGQSGLFLYISQARTGAEKKLFRNEQQDNYTGGYFHIYS